jgi:CIC family chloride channel protein
MRPAGARLAERRPEAIRSVLFIYTNKSGGQFVPAEDPMSDDRRGFELRAGPRLWWLWRRSRRLAREVEFFLARRFGLATAEDRRFFLLIPLVGAIAGLLGIAVHRTIDALRTLLWGGSGELSATAAALPPSFVIGILMIGGLGVGVLTWLGKQSLAGQGMSVLIESVALRGGAIEPKPVVLRALAGVFTVGAGGSLGREGPMIRLGAMIASRLGLRLGIGAHRLKILVGCGAAAGLAAAYNIPIGGALFAMEVILGNFALEIFGPIVVASVISTLLARASEGSAPIYGATAYQLVSGWELFAYAGLGLLGALVSLLFVAGVRAGGVAFAKLRFLPESVRPILGMALVGGLAVFVPQVLGSGLETITASLGGQLSLVLLLVLPLAKLVATALTAGSGCAGGLFTPALFMGAMAGGAYGHLVHALFPNATGEPGAYAAVGMAAVAAGTSHAPISAILILFEFTGNYQLILPLMVASILASATARALYKYSIYTEALQRRGVDVALRMEEVVLAGLRVRELVREDKDLLRPEDEHRAVVQRFLNTRRQRLFVVDSGGRLQGAVSLHDVKHALEAGAEGRIAREWMGPPGVTVRDEERLHRAAELFAQSDFERLPVVDAGGRFMGVLTKRDLLGVYAQEVLGRPGMLATFVRGGPGAARNYVELPPDFSVRVVELPDRLAGLTLAQLRLTQATGARILEIKRRSSGGGDWRVIPEATTQLRRGDELILLGPNDDVEALAAGRGWPDAPA